MINCNCQTPGLLVRTLKNPILHILRVQQLWIYLFLSLGENETIEAGAGGDETANRLTTSASQGRVGGSKEHWENPEVKLAWMNSTNTRSNGPAFPSAFLVIHAWCHPGYFKALRKWLSLVFCCVQSKLHGDLSLVTAAQHIHIGHASCCCYTSRRSLFLPKLYTEAHSDTESSKALRDKSLSYFIFQRWLWGM